MEELFKLTEEQTRVLQEISDKIEEFEKLGGYLFYDYFDYGFRAINTKNTADFKMVFEDTFSGIPEEYENKGYIDACEFSQRIAILDVPEFSDSSHLVARLNNPNPNLF